MSEAKKVRLPVGVLNILPALVKVAAEMHEHAEIVVNDVGSYPGGSSIQLASLRLSAKGATPDVWIFERPEGGTGAGEDHE